MAQVDPHCDLWGKKERRRKDERWWIECRGMRNEKAWEWKKSFSFFFFLCSNPFHIVITSTKRRRTLTSRWSQIYIWPTQKLSGTTRTQNTLLISLKVDPPVHVMRKNGYSQSFTILTNDRWKCWTQRKKESCYRFELTFQNANK